MLLKDLSYCVKKLKSFNSNDLKSSFEEIISQNQWSFEKVLGLLRLAMVGELSGPDLFALMQELKKETCVKRIDNLLKALSA